MRYLHLQHHDRSDRDHAVAECSQPPLGHLPSLALPVDRERERRFERRTFVQASKLERPVAVAVSERPSLGAGGAPPSATAPDIVGTLHAQADHGLTARRREGAYSKVGPAVAIPSSV